MILLHNILVATDFGPAADAALMYGRALARTFGAQLHLLHVSSSISTPSSRSRPGTDAAWWMRG